MTTAAGIAELCQRLRERGGSYEGAIRDQELVRVYAAEAADRIHRLEAENARLEAEAEEVRDCMSYPAFEDDRISYVEVQIDRDVWKRIKAEKEAARAPES